MKSNALLLFVMLILSAHHSVRPANAANSSGTGTLPPAARAIRQVSEANFNLSAFGAVGDGVADDGPALQAALDAIAEAGGGTLFVPAGRYAINTPVSKDFSGLATSVTIKGVESSTPVPPRTSLGDVLSRGLDLVSEFFPRTTDQGVALSVTGLESFLIQDIAFVGTPDIDTDALITLNIASVEDAIIRHCEFYGLSTQVGPAIVQSYRSRLTIEQSVFLGSTANSGIYGSVVQNLEWKGVAITDSLFIDYGQRPELFSKTGLSAPFSWVNLGNAATPTNESPRREMIIRNVFLDEGGFVGLSSLPDWGDVPSAPIDLVYISGLYMNVSNLETTGHYFYKLENLLIEDSHYGWSLNSGSAITLMDVSNAILDRLECVDSADHIIADAATEKLTVINSVYGSLDSEAPMTRVITTATPDEDPVQHVRQQFNAVLGREPDAAAHFYWSNQILECNDDSQCVADRRARLATYLAGTPSPVFAINGQVTDGNGGSLSDVSVTLSGSQVVTTSTDSMGKYHFSNLPTSGSYSVTASKPDYTFGPDAQAFITPTGDQAGDFAAIISRHSISGHVADADGIAVEGATINLSGTQSGTTTTDVSGNYSFADLPAGGSYTVVASTTHHTFAEPSQTLYNLVSSQTANFVATLSRHTISGRVVNVTGSELAGVTITLSGSQTATTTTDSNGWYAFPNLPAGANYIIQPSSTSYSWAPQALAVSSLSTNQTADFVGTSLRFIEFGAASYSVMEGTATINITVTRFGDTSGAAAVNYAATNGTGIQGHDVGAVIGRLSFAPAELTRTFTIFITDDSFVESVEQLTITLSAPEGATLGSRASVLLSINDNDSGSSNQNPVDNAEFFVRQHYRDFLSREPDAAGLAFWANQIISCGTDAACVDDRRINVSAAFFLSIEFQETGFLVHRLYKASFAQPPQYLSQFLMDTRTIGQGVVVNTAGWQQQLENNKTAFVKAFVERPDFLNQYPLALSPTEFVNALNTKAGSPLAADGLALAVAEFSGSSTSADTGARARVLRRTAESETLSNQELSSAFVLMQYFGYLQRNPYDPPDTNLGGYNFWLAKLNEFGGDFRRAQMVRSFLVSIEYRSRFGL